MTENKLNGKTLSAVLACPWLLVAGTCVLTAVAALMSEYPEISAGTVSLISTLPGLTMMIASVVAGFFAGRYGSYKVWMIATGVLVAVSGALPCFVSDFYVILVFRAILGLALGTVFPLTNAVIFELYEGDLRTKILGWHSASQYIGAVFYTMIGGVVSRLYWRYAFLTYLIALLPTMITALFLPDVRRTVAEPDSRPKEKKERRRREIPGHGLFFLLLEFIGFVFIFPFSLNISVILSESNLGDSVISGLVLSANTVAAAVGGFCFKAIYSRLKNLTIPLSFFLCAVGMLIIFWSYSIALMFLGGIFCGFGISIFTLAIISSASGFIRNESIALFSGLMSASSSLGTFCTSWYISALEKLGLTSARIPLLGSGLLFVGMGLITVATELRYNARNKTA